MTHGTSQNIRVARRTSECSFTHGEELASQTHRDLLLQIVASVRQLVVRAVERKGLHDVRAGPQKLAMQLGNYNGITCAIVFPAIARAQKRDYTM